VLTVYPHVPLNAHWINEHIVAPFLPTPNHQAPEAHVKVFLPVGNHGVSQLDLLEISIPTEMMRTKNKYLFA
jgi:hypothetical protein